jgi:hypothetical protein
MKQTLLRFWVVVLLIVIGAFPALFFERLTLACLREPTTAMHSICQMGAEPAARFLTWWHDSGVAFAYRMLPPFAAIVLCLAALWIARGSRSGAVRP